MAVMNVPKHRLENVCNRIRGLYVSLYLLFVSRLCACILLIVIMCSNYKKVLSLQL
jgi:hypothetical protein